MGLLPRPRRDRRSRSPRFNRRQSRKFIPDSDSEFAYTAGGFEKGIASDPERFHLTTEDAAIITEAVTNFRSALAKTLHRFSRTERSVMEKDTARKKAEEVVRKYGGIIRANPDISHIDKDLLRIKVRPKKLGRTSCPRTAPFLRFLGAYDQSGPASAMHVLQFKDEHGSSTRAKPRGSVRMELFIEWVPQGAPIPKTPYAMYGRPWYLRSYTRSKFVVDVPVPPVAMLIVYWGRWADSKGNVGPWSKTVIARVEGWSASGEPAQLPADGACRALPAGPREGLREIRSDARFFLAEREVRERYMEGAGALPPAEAQRELDRARQDRLPDAA